MNILALPAPKQVTLPVGQIDAADIRKICGVERLRSFNVVATTRKSYVSSSTVWKKFGCKGRFPVTTNTAAITSFASVSENMVTIHHATRPTMTKLAPAGTKFAADDGLYIVRLSDCMDYHPTASDWTARDFASRVRKGMAENFKRRTAMKKAEKIAAKDAKEKARIEKIFHRDIATTTPRGSACRRSPVHRSRRKIVHRRSKWG